MAQATNLKPGPKTPRRRFGDARRPDPEQIDRMKRAVPMFSALLVDDQQRADALFQAAGMEIQRVVDGLFMLGIALVNPLAAFRR